MTSRLRYPVAPIYDTTDYLQINIVEYKSVNDLRGGGNKTDGILVGRPGSRRNGKKLNTVITLPIPSNIVDNNAVSYQDDKINALAAALAGGAVTSMTGLGAAVSALFSDNANASDEVKKTVEGLRNVIGSTGLNFETAKGLVTKQLASSAASIFGGNVSLNQIQARTNGTIFNPNMELLFNGPTLRSFRFQFKMTPRNADEAEQVKNIIKTIKMSMAPKTQNITTIGGAQSRNLYLKTPSVFELTYKQGNQDHSFLHKFKQCFLENVSVNYTGEGTYATYGDGTPVSMTMDLQFKELEPIYDMDYDDVKEGVGY